MSTRPLYSFKSVDIANLISNGTGGSTGANGPNFNGYNFYTGLIQNALSLGSDLSFGNPLPFNFKYLTNTDMSSYYSAFFQEFNIGSTANTKFPAGFTNNGGATGNIRAIMIGAGAGGGAGGGGGFNPTPTGSNQQNGGGGGGGGGGALTYLNKQPIAINTVLTYNVGVGGIGGIGSGADGTDGGIGTSTSLFIGPSILSGAAGGIGGKGGKAGANTSNEDGNGGVGGTGGGYGGISNPYLYYGTNGISGQKSVSNSGGAGGYATSLNLYGLTSISVGGNPGQNGTQYGAGGGGGTSASGKGSGLNGGSGGHGYLRIYYLLD